MILWCDGRHDARENMRRDAALLREADEAGPEAEPVLRLFGFDPPGITLGHAQEAARELDLKRCARDGVIWAVRPTGGRAIFHADEWTYSLVAPIHDPEWGGSLAASYDRVARLLLEALARLGVAASFAPAATRDRVGRGARGPAAPCFASATRHEILRDGRKLVGSAQRRTARALLQQGSVLLSDAHLRLVDYLALPQEVRARTRERLRAASIHMGDRVGERAALAPWADALASALPAGVRRLDGVDAFPLTV